MMRPNWLVTAPCLALMFFTARAAADEKPTHDSVVKDYVTTIKALTKSVRDIKDASTMDKTKAEFEKAKDHFEALNDRLIDLGKPPADQKEKWKNDIKDASTMDKTKAEFEKAKDHFEALNDRLIDLGKPPADQKEKWNKNIKDADASDRKS